MIRILITIILVISSNSQYSQSQISDEEKLTHLNKIALKLWSSVPQSYAMPVIEIYSDSKYNVDAHYYLGRINFGSNMYDLCNSFGEDAIAAILAHEMGHYFYKHTAFGTRRIPLYSYALNETDSLFMDTTKLKNIEELEMQADIFAAMKCFVAGYDISESMPKIIKAIYTNNRLPSKLERYISLEKRVKISQTALDHFNKLLPYYNAARYALLIGQYEIAGDLFSFIGKSGYRASDIYLNAGIAYTRAALNYATESKRKFYYPFLMELNSNINSLNTMSERSEKDESYKKLKFDLNLSKAENNFRKIINKDIPQYSHLLNFGCQQLIAENQTEALANSILAYDNASSNREKSLALILKSLVSYFNKDTSGAITFLDMASSLYESTIAELNKCIILENKCNNLYTGSNEIPDRKTENIKNIKHNQLLDPSDIWKLKSDTFLKNSNNSKIFQFDNDIIGLKYISDSGSFAIVENKNNNDISTARGLKIGDHILKITQEYGKPAIILNDTQGKTLVFRSLNIAFRIDRTDNIKSWFIFEIK